MPYMPAFIAPARFTDPDAALEQVRLIYNGGLQHLRDAMQRFVAGESLPGRVRACYPFVRIHTHTVSRSTPPANAGLSYGFVSGPGRYDYPLHRLRHYSGTAPEWFQNFVLFTNYQFYIDEFVRLGHEAMTDENSEYIAFIEPGNVITRRRGLAAASSSMYGELLDGSQGTLPLWVPIPALSEIQLALEKAVAEVTGTKGTELKKIMRTGTVASTDNRNWELLPGNQPQRRFSQSRAVALDMESATIAANGFRFRVPYGTLLCVSDEPLHGEIKLPGMANEFYRQRVDQHLRIGMRAIEILRSEGSQRLHSRKLRAFDEVAFQ